MSSTEGTDGANSAGEIGGAESGRRRGNVSLQTDPLVSSSWNSYAYASANPVSSIDPDGMLDSMTLWDCVMVMTGDWGDYTMAQILECTEDWFGGGGGGGGGGSGWGSGGPNDCDWQLDQCGHGGDTPCLDSGESAFGIVHEYHRWGEYGDERDYSVETQYHCLRFRCGEFLTEAMTECYGWPELFNIQPRDPSRTIDTQSDLFKQSNK